MYEQNACSLGVNFAKHSVYMDFCFLTQGMFWYLYVFMALAIHKDVISRLILMFAQLVCLKLMGYVISGACFFGICCVFSFKIMVRYLLVNLMSSQNQDDWCMFRTIYPVSYFPVLAVLFLALLLQLLIHCLLRKGAVSPDASKILAQEQVQIIYHIPGGSSIWCFFKKTSRNMVGLSDPLYQSSMDVNKVFVSSQLNRIR